MSSPFYSMVRGINPSQLIHKHIPTTRLNLRTHTGACRFSSHLECIPKSPLTHASKGRPQNQREPHEDQPSGRSEQDEGTKLPKNSGTTKPQAPILQMVPSLPKEHNSQHPKGREHQQQRTLLTHTTRSDIYFSAQGQQSKSDKPTTLSFLRNKDLVLLIMPPMP